MTAPVHRHDGRWLVALLVAWGLIKVTPTRSAWLALYSLAVVVYCAAAARMVWFVVVDARRWAHRQTLRTSALTGAYWVAYGAPIAWVRIWGGWWWPAGGAALVVWAFLFVGIRCAVLEPQLRKERA